MECTADNKHLTLVVNGKEYPTKIGMLLGDLELSDIHSSIDFNLILPIVQLPCILETHKTYDDNLFYKSGEIGQCFVVTDKEQEQKQLEEVEEVPNGITPPNTNVVKRKYEKTKRYTPFPVRFIFFVFFFIWQ